MKPGDRNQTETLNFNSVSYKEVWNLDLLFCQDVGIWQFFKTNGFRIYKIIDVHFIFCPFYGQIMNRESSEVSTDFFPSLSHIWNPINPPHGGFNGITNPHSIPKNPALINTQNFETGFASGRIKSGLNLTNLVHLTKYVASFSLNVGIRIYIVLTIIVSMAITKK